MNTKRMLATGLLGMAMAVSVITTSETASAAPASAQWSSKATSAVVPAKKGKPYVLLNPGADGKPTARWNPCRPITWAVSAKRLLKGEIPRLTKAFAAISKATGLTFAYNGVAPGTTEDPTFHTPTIPGTDIALVFENFRKTFPQAAGASGFGGSQTSSSSASPLIRVGPGYARFDRPDFSRLSGSLREALYLHELGHVIGLDHAPGRNIMNPTLSASITQFSKGDRAGLALLGAQAGDCDPGSPYLA